ncbi:MAG: hypothetical protein ABFE01_23875, partial [Phycisphaerales bacterium]
MTDETPTIFDRLREPFPPEDIDQLPREIKRGPRAGTTIQLDYAGHAAVTDRLIDVDPEHWRWEPFAIDELGLPRIIRRGDSLELWIRLTIGGKTMPGVGTVPVEYDKTSGTELPADQDTAKELIGDAIRNAAMRFGVGLDLWRKHGPAEAAPAGPPCPHCQTPVRRNPSPQGKQPIWSCPNAGCGGGEGTRKDGTHWPWASWDPSYFKESEGDGPLTVVTSGREPPLVPADAFDDLTLSLVTLGVGEDQARSELEAYASNPGFAAGAIKEMRAGVNRAANLV